MRVVVIGGGVAGSAAAVAMCRVGADVTVYEAHPDPAGPYGSFVSLAGNGLRALDALGCLRAVQAAGFPVDRQLMWSGSGRLLGDVPRGRRSSDPVRSVTLRRADLVTVLRAEAVASGARIHTGERVESVEHGACQDADLVIGGDGIRSSIRRVVDPEVGAPTYAGLFTASGISTGRAGRTDSFNMIFGRRGAFIHLTAPDGLVWWSAQIAAPVAPDPRTIGLAEVQACFAAEPTATQILRQADRLDAVTLTEVLGPVRRQHDGRVVLIGDAAHPVGAGQGASMALEDAVLLAQLEAREAAIPEALANFVKVRAGRLGKLARTASSNREAKIAGPVAARMRNFIMPLVFNRAYERATGWLYDFDPGTLPARLDVS